MSVQDGGEAPLLLSGLAPRLACARRDRTTARRERILLQVRKSDVGTQCSRHTPVRFVPDIRSHGKHASVAGKAGGQKV
jgi:hypothetical protein